MSKEAHIYRAVHVSGNANNGSKCSVRLSNANNDFGNRNANISSHLSLLLCVLSSPLGEINNSNKCISRETENSKKKKQILKRYNNLYSKIANIDNLRLAYTNAKKGKGKYREVIKIEKNPEFYIEKLHDILINESFVNSEYVVFKKVTGGKIREIYKLPFFPDRVLHHAIMQVLEPIWLSIFIRNTFSTIKGRGIHDGVKKVKKSLLTDVEGTQYCLKLDIKKYYPSVDHVVLKDIVTKKIKDKKLLSLLDTIINSANGIPIGNYVSQWFGNLYLAYFDHFVKEQLKIKHYFRYADDIVLLYPNKEYLHFCFANIQEYLSNETNLAIKENEQIFKVDDRGLDFLGYRFWHTHTLVRKRIVKAFKKKTQNKKATKNTQSAYWGWFKHANSYNLIKKYFNMKEFSDFATEKKRLEGDKISIDKILNKSIIITGYSIKKSHYENEGDCLTIGFEIDGEKHICFTSSSVLTDQLKKYEKEIPFKTKIKKIHKYFTLS